MRFGPEWTEEHTLADGMRVRLRLLRPDDRARLVAGFAKLSDASRYARFFTAMPRLPDATLDKLLATDGWNHVAIVAGTADDAEEGLGIARFIRLEDAPDTAEAAVAVVDHAQHRGLGALLLSRLTAAARERGITRFRAEVMRTNAAMLALLHDVDAAAMPTYDGPIAVYELALPGGDDAEARRGPLFGLLRLAAAGVEVVLRRLLPTPPA